MPQPFNDFQEGYKTQSEKVPLRLLKSVINSAFQKGVILQSRKSL